MRKGNTKKISRNIKTTKQSNKKIATSNIHTTSEFKNNKKSKSAASKSHPARKTTHSNQKSNTDPYKKIIENLQEGIFELDLAGHYTFLNEAVCLALGYTRKELIGSDAMRYVEINDRERVLKIYNNVYQTGQSARDVGYYIMRKDGVRRYIDASVQLRKDTSGKPIGFQGIACDISERKRSEGQLRKSEDIFRVLFNQSSHLMGLMKPDGTLLRINDIAKYFAGIREEDVIGKLFWNTPWWAHSKEEQRRLRAAIRQAAKGKFIRYETTHPDATGVIHYIDFSISPVKDSDGDVILLIPEGSDITERKWAEDELKHSRESYMRLFEDHAAVKLIINPSDGTILEANNAAVQYYGWTREEMQQMKISDINTLTPEEVKNSLDKAHINKKSRFEFGHRLANGSIREVEVFSSPIQMNGKKVLHSIVFDITERKLTQLKFQESEERYRRITENMSDFVSELDTQGIFRYNSPSIRRILGYDPKELIGISAFDFVHPEDRDRVIATYMDGINTESSREVEQRYRRKDGTYIWLRSSGNPFYGSDGSNIGMIVNSNDITERKKAEEDLKTAYKQLENIIEFLPDATMICDKDKKIIAWNRAMEIMTDISKTAMIGQDMHEITIPFYGERRMFLMDLVFISDKELEEKYSNVKRFGNVIQAETFTPALYNKTGAYVFAAACPLLDNEGNVVGIIESIRDVTQRKLAEEELRQNEIKYRTLFESANDSILIMDKDIFIDCNEKTLELYACTSEQIIGQPPYIFSPEFQPDGRKSREKALEKINAALDGHPQFFEWKHCHYNGTLFDAEVSLNAFHYKGKTHIQAIVRDITERKKAEEELHRVQLFNEALLESIPGILYLYDDTGHLVRWNKQHELLTGYSSNEMKDRYVLDWFGGAEPDTSNIKKGIADVLKNGYSTAEAHLITKNGEAIFMFFTGIKLNISGKNHLLGIGVDISERKKAEDEIIRLNEFLEQRVRNRTAELEAFSYSVSHDLRAPLRAIQGFGQALMEDYYHQLDEAAKNYLNRIKRATKTMDDLIEDMLKLSRISRAEMDNVPVNLSYIVKSIMDELQQTQPERKVNIIIAENLIESVDPRLMRLVFENLLSNAWKFTAKNDKNEIEFGRLNKNGKPVYFVRDNGAGFDMKYAKKLFSPFQRLHSTEDYPGTGIGLAIVKRIISRHGGTVWAEAFVGKGTTIYFTLND